MIFKAENIRKSYGKKQVLKDVSFSISSGRCLGLLGGNGSGKSTLLSILSGAVSADWGKAWADDTDLFASRCAGSRLVGYVPQGTPLMQELTAWDNLRLWYDKETLNRELETGVLSVLGIGRFLKVPVKKLSGGMKKRLSIGCAMAGRPPILLLDEPTAALDLACKQDIARYLQRYKAAGGILVLTTHDPAELSLCDEVYILKDGVLSSFEFTGDVDALVKRL